MALDGCGKIGGAPADQTESEDLVDHFARLAASSQPAGKSRRKAQQEAKGLPDSENLKEMAKAYLEMQREHWPELAQRGLLPKPTPKVIERMAAEFEAHFRDGEPTTIGQLLSNPPWVEIGAGHLRFSDDNSNPRSLVQQLRNVLERAARDKVFAPWELVFADAAVSGTTAARRGHQLAKQTIQGTNGPQTLYVDELGRAARDAIETLKLGQLIVRIRKRLIGANGGFDSDTPRARPLVDLNHGRSCKRSASSRRRSRSSSPLPASGRNRWDSAGR